LVSNLLEQRGFGWQVSNMHPHVSTIPLKQSLHFCLVYQLAVADHEDWRGVTA